MDYQQLISIENLFQAFEEFKKGKRKRRDVQEFERNLEVNLFSLYEDLKEKTYMHGSYYSFYVHDPKLRHIHKAGVRDRVVHHLLYKYLYDLFDRSFIFDSYSCRLNKGTHKSVKRLEKFTQIVSKNYSRDIWVLKLDIKKFFSSVDHQTLLELLQKKIKDPDIVWLLNKVINSFHSEFGSGKGIPLGNLTSQVFANIYMNELDRFVKYKLKSKFYLRYADDFICLSKNKRELEKLVSQINTFLKNNLELGLHPNKILFRQLHWGIDFLGYITLSHYRLPRTKTKRRIFQKLKQKSTNPSLNQSFQSYLGYLSHANSHKLSQDLKNKVWLWKEA